MIASTTVAGAAGQYGSADGRGAAARFNAPHGIAVDGAGNMFVTDTDNYLIRRISAAGDVTTVAGAAGQRGSADGRGAAARFNYPYDIAVDGAGTVYVADTSNHLIRRISVTGDVTTVAGAAGQAGSADGRGAAARFNEPTCIAVDGAGNVYVADTRNHLIRHISVAGDVTTVVGAAKKEGSADGRGAAARFYSPCGIAVDGAGNVFVADTGRYLICRISATGDVTTVAGTARDCGNADGRGAAARFNEPAGIAVDGAGNAYVADKNNNVIRRIR